MEYQLKSNRKENPSWVEPIIPTPYISLPKHICNNSTTLKIQNTSIKEESLSNLNLNVSNMQNRTISALINQSKSLLQQNSQSPRFYQSQQKASFKYILNQPQCTKNKSPQGKTYKSESQIVRDWTLNIISKKKLFVKTENKLQRKLTQFKFQSFHKIKQLFHKNIQKNYKSMKSSYQINAVSFYMTMQKVQGIQKIQKILKKSIKNCYQQCWNMIKYISQKQLFVLSNTINNTMNNQNKNNENRSILNNELELNSFLNSNLQDKQLNNYKSPYSTTENTRIKQISSNLKQSLTNNESKQYQRLKKSQQNVSKPIVHKVSNQLYISIKEKPPIKNKSQKSLKIDSDIRKNDENSDKDSQCSIQLKQQSNFNSQFKKNKLNSSQNLKQMSSKQRSQISDNLSALILNMNQIKFEDYCIKTTNQIKINNVQGSNFKTQDNIHINCQTNVNFSVVIKPESQYEVLPIQTKVQKKSQIIKPQSPQFLPIDSTTHFLQRQTNKNKEGQIKNVFDRNQTSTQQRKASHSFDDRLKFSFCPKNQNLTKNPFQQLKNNNFQNRKNFQVNNPIISPQTQATSKQINRTRVVSFSNNNIQRCVSSPKVTFNFVNQENKFKQKKQHKSPEYRTNYEYYDKSPQKYQQAQIKIKNNGVIRIQQKSIRNNYFLEKNNSQFSNYTSPSNYFPNFQVNQKVQNLQPSSPYFVSIKSSTHFSNNYQNIQNTNQNYGLDKIHKNKKVILKLPNLVSQNPSKNRQMIHHLQPKSEEYIMNQTPYYEYENKNNQKQEFINKQLTKMKHSKQKILVTSAHKYKYT